MPDVPRTATEILNGSARRAGVVAGDVAALRADLAGRPVRGMDEADRQRGVDLLADLAAALRAVERSAADVRADLTGADLTEEDPTHDRR